MRYITHSKYRNWSKCDVRRILNCDIYRIYFLNAMYVASACGVLQQATKEQPPPVAFVLCLCLLHKMFFSRISLIHKSSPWPAALCMAHMARQTAYVAPEAVEANPYHLLKDLWDETALDSLMALVRSRNFSSAKTDLTARLPHLGEGAPVGTAACDHPMLVPSADGATCVLPSRLDIATHFLKSNGHV